MSARRSDIVIASPTRQAQVEQTANENVIDNGQSVPIDLQAAVNIPTDDEGFGDV